MKDPDELAPRIEAIAGDRESGASDILDAAIGVLRDALASGETGQITRAARALCRAQPTMAPVWNAAIEAVLACRAEAPTVRRRTERFERFAQRVARAPGALARFAAECFALDDPAAPLRLVTLSSSRSVLTAIGALAAARTLRLACAEGRPGLEGRRLAAAIGALGIPVTFFSDAAIGQALAVADAVLVGADAIAPEWFLNKSGTRMLAAAAAQQGVPFYVVATREKFVGHGVAARLVVREGAPEEIWDAPPPGVTVRNPYFEATPLDLITGVISDAGVLGAGMVADVCTESADAARLEALAELTR